MHSILQLVPSLPPETGGVGDYALTLANELSRSHAISTSFLVGKPSWQGAAQLDGFPVARVQSRTAENLAHAIEQSAASVVLLQLSGYGYDPNGCPAWVADGLRMWKAKSGGRLVTMFHELYAFGPPWKKSFWLSARQRTIVAQIAQQSDAAVTNLARYRDLIEHFDAAKRNQVRILPVFCNIGEPPVVPGLSPRRKRIVVFGGAPTRLRAYTTGKKALLKTCQVLGIQEIADVGPHLGGIPRSLENVPIVPMGVLDAHAASALMLDSTAGFLNYFPSRQAKSSVFAAYCAHGLLPVAPDAQGSLADGVQAGKHYWYANDSGLSLEVAQQIATAALDWYHEHSLEAHASVFASLVTREFPVAGQLSPLRALSQSGISV